MRFENHCSPWRHTSVATIKDDKIIGLYAAGVKVRDIRGQFEDVYSPDQLSVAVNTI